MSESITCDGCGRSCHSAGVQRRTCDLPWFEIGDTGGAARRQHACSPDCLMRIGRQLGGELRDDPTDDRLPERTEA